MVCSYWLTGPGVSEVNLQYFFAVVAVCSDSEVAGQLPTTAKPLYFDGTIINVIFIESIRPHYSQRKDPV